MDDPGLAMAKLMAIKRVMQVMGALVVVLIVWVEFSG